MALKIIVWGLFICLLLIVGSMCYIACALPYGQAIVTTNMNSSIIGTLMTPCAGILSLFGVMLKELLSSSPKDKGYD